MTRMFVILIALVSSLVNNAQKSPDAICGKWKSHEGNLIVEIYRENSIFKAKVVWFDDKDDKSKPMNDRKDEKNPDKSLRNRRIIGMEVLEGLKYNAKDNRWEDGKIYDSSSGKTWDASVWLADNGSLKVRGYWLFEFMGKTMKFQRET
jgi:uncharacterized protein (DUF2147 family)